MSLVNVMLNKLIIINEHVFASVADFLKLVKDV